MSLSDDLEHIGEHIGDDQPNLPPGAKNTLLLAAKALRKLPHTADGVPVVPGMEVWVRSGCGSVGRYKGMYDDGYGMCVISDDGDRIPLMVFDNSNTGEPAKIYSTRQSAEEASKA